MADQIAGLLQRERRSGVPDAPAVGAAGWRSSREESHVEAHVAPPKPAAPMPLPPVVIKPAGGSAAAVAAAPARSNGSGSPSAETLRPVAIATEIAPVPFPRREEKREPRKSEHKAEAAPAPANKSNLTVLDAVAGEPERSKPGKLVVIAGVAILALAAVAVWMFLASRKSSSSAPQQAAQPAQTAPASQPIAAAATTPATNTNATALTPSTPAATSNNKSNAPEKPESKRADSQKNDKQNKPAPVPATVALNSGPSKISSGPTDQSADVAPSLSVGSGSPSLNTLAKPVGTSVPSILTQSELVNAKAIRAIPASYPEIAKARRISGTVVVTVIVGKDGKVRNPRFVSGPMVFRDAAFDAVKQWLFKPATLNGQPIEQETEITVKFNPS
jgi:TonB family protein